jgi:hypothetical protein
MKKVLISKLYQADTDTWTEVYRMERSVFSTENYPPLEDVQWPENKDVLYAREIVQIYLGTTDVTISDVRRHTHRLREAGAIVPVYGGKLIKINGTPMRYYAVRNASKYKDPNDVRRHLTGK